MCEAFEAIWELHTEDKIPLRTAAFVKALQVGGWVAMAGFMAHGAPLSGARMDAWWDASLCRAAGEASISWGWRRRGLVARLGC